MSIDELEAEALKLGPQARARLAGRLLDSLESLSAEENEQLWLEEGVSFHELAERELNDAVLGWPFITERPNMACTRRRA